MPLDVHSAARQNAARLEIAHVVADEVLVRQAIHVHEDEPVEAADVDGAVQDARLAKAEILVADVLDGMKQIAAPSARASGGSLPASRRRR